MSGEAPFTRRGLLCSVAVLCCFLCGRPSFADDAKPDPEAAEKAVRDQTTKVAAVEDAVAKHAAEGADEALTGDAESALALAADVSDPKLKSRLVEVIGKILDATRADAVERPAIQALGVLAEPAGFRHLRPFLASHTMEALDAARKMRADESVPVLMDLVRDHPDLNVAKRAMHAFSTFGRNFATRERILEQLVRIVELNRTMYRWKGNLGSGKDEKPRRPNRIRYDALSGQMYVTLEELTGHKLKEDEDWFDLVDKHGHELSTLFSVPQDSGGAQRDLAGGARDVSSIVSTARVTALEAVVAAHIAARDADALASDVATVATLSAAIPEPSLRGRLAVLVGRILDGTRDATVQRSAIEALGRLEAPEGFRFIRRFLLVPPASGRPIIREAIDAISKMKSDESVPVLLALVRDHPETKVAAAAVKAFSTFGDNKATRETIVSHLVATVKARQNEPGVSRPPPCAAWPAGELSRYQVLASVLSDTLNAMTGRDAAGPEEWFDLVEKHREDLSALFIP